MPTRKKETLEDNFDKGMDVVLRQLKKEREYPEFYTFEIDFSPHVTSPYPRDHDLLTLRATYHFKDNVPSEVIQHEHFEFLMSHRSQRWYRCSKYRKVGNPLT